MALLFIDARLQSLELLRKGVSLLTHPIQRVAHAPVFLFENAGNYFSSLSRFQEENARLKRKQLDGATTLLRTNQLEVENDRLRKLLEIRERPKTNGRVAQILYAARDPFSRRVIVDKGQQDRMIPGQPVIDDVGVMGQVTRVFPYVSEVTLITDKEQAIPVQIVRNGLRSVAFGLGNGQLELRFMPANADVQNGDLLVTSGLDGVFLAGLPVAKVVRIERDTSYSFARINCVPLAGVENFSEVMVLDSLTPLNLPTELTAETSPGAIKSAAKPSFKKKRLKRE